MSVCIACTPPGLRVSTACLGMSACTPSCMGDYCYLPGNEHLSDMQVESPTTPTAAEAEADSPGNPSEESPAGNPNARLSTDQRRSHQLNQPLQVLRPTALRTQRRSHQQASQMPDSPCRPEVTNYADCHKS